MRTLTKNIKRVPCPNGIPLTRIHKVKCLCGNEFHVDLGVEWKPNTVIRFKKCGTTLGKTSIVITNNWETNLEM